MSRVHIVVEGQTEEGFVRNVLVPYLANRGIYITQTIVRTRRFADDRPDFVGGAISYGKLKFDIQRALNNPAINLVTTMVDLYALPHSFPGRSSCPPNLSGAQKANYIEAAIDADVSHDRFASYVAAHEFEALLFVDPAIVQQAFPDINCQDRLQRVKDQFASPEDINDSPLTAPSKRLEAICYGEYQKVVHGPLITETIGLENLRAGCPHFDSWLARLEATV